MTTRLPASRLAARLKQEPPRGGDVYLFVGDDAPARRAALAQVREAARIDARDAFQSVALTSGDLSADEGRLADEIGAISMFGGLRLVAAAPSARQIERAFAVAQAIDRRDCLVCFELDEPPAATPDDAAFIWVDCARPGPAEVERWIRTGLADIAPPLGADEIDWLVERLAEDPDQAREAVEKISLFYAAASGPAPEGVSARALVSGEAEALADDVAAAVADGRMRDFVAFTEKDDAAARTGALVLAAQRLMANRYRGAVRGARWAQGDPATLRRAIIGLAQAVRAERSDPLLGDLAARRALLALTLLHSRRR